MLCYSGIAQMCWWFFTLWALHSAPADDRCAWGIDLNPPSPQVFFKLKKPPRNLRTGVLMRPFVALLPCLPECLSRPSSLFKQLRALCPSCSDYHWNCSLPGLQFSDPLKLPGIFVLLARMFHFALASKCLTSEALRASVTPIQLLSLRMSNLTRPSAPCSPRCLTGDSELSAVVGRNGAAVC
jgi:hypothetical protein